MNWYPKIIRFVILLIVSIGLGWLTLYFFGYNPGEALIKTWGIALLLMIISSVYVEYFFISPKNAIVNSINAIILSFALYPFKREAFWIILVYSIIVLLSGIFALIFEKRFQEIDILRQLPYKLGKAKFIFPIIAVFESLNIDLPKFNIDDTRLFWLIITYWIVFSLISSERSIIWLTQSFPKLFLRKGIGIVAGNLWPNIILMDCQSRDFKINDLVWIGDNFDKALRKYPDEITDKLGLILDFIGNESEESVARARLYLINEPQRDLHETKTGLIGLGQKCFKINNPEKFLEPPSSKLAKSYWDRRKDIIALVGAGSTINLIKGNLVRFPQDLENAQLVSTIYGDIENIKMVRYQIIEAETQRETEETKKDSGFTQFDAYQLGIWGKAENNTHRFSEFQWVPDINKPLLKWSKKYDEKDIEPTTEDKKGNFLIGCIPKTDLPIYLNLEDFISHHAAILGVTGSGKSTLVFKLLKEISEKQSDVLVICIDITGEYKNNMDNYQEFIDDKMKEAWKKEWDKFQDAKEEAKKNYNDKDMRRKAEKGYDSEIIKFVKKRIEELRKENPRTIFELSDILNTERSIDSTRLVVQGILEYGKTIYDKNNLTNDGEKDNFRCLLVLEEAHTLVPENLGIGGGYKEFEPIIEKISQVALQGRKYNVGFLLISQRTATVKKTVLNQCNSMIAFRAYDETSFNFLSSYFGERYVKEIAHLKNDGDSRYIIAAGKAVIADRPLIVEIKK